MDHLGVLQEKIVNLRAEIAQIHEQNEQYRRQKGNGTLDQVAHGQRHERLQNIQKELGQLAALGRSVVSINQRREENRARLQLIKQSRVFFSPFGADCFRILYPRLAPWAVILRRFAAVFTALSPTQSAPRHPSNGLIQPRLLAALCYRLTNCVHIEKFTEISVAG